MLSRAATSHVHRYEQLHVLGAFPGKVLDGQQDHVGVGAGGGLGVVLSPTLRGKFVLSEQLHGRGSLRVEDITLRIPKDRQ